jgi:uncharacterized protein YegJ (DUF2314 family)
MNAIAFRCDKVAGSPWTGDGMPALSARLKFFAMVAMIAVLGSSILLMDASAQDRSQNQDRSPVYDVANGDPEMAAAIAKARASLPVFWASYEAPKGSEAGHSLKVRFTVPNRRNSGEHIWMAEVKKLPSGRYSARFANQPRDLPGKRVGDLVEFAEADISDWMFMRNGKIVGGETIRPLLKSMSRADADAMRARMETP